jgi:hypothetical protein
MVPRVKQNTAAGVTEDPTAVAMMGPQLLPHAPDPGRPSAH